ncbi:MAG: hypothetical protein QXW01_00155 [Candidatus Aenigmatarchaeota archaeon]
MIVFQQNKRLETLEVLNCEISKKSFKSFYKFDEKQNIIYGIIISNCGIKKYDLIIEKNYYIIKEIGGYEDLLRCICEREFRIYNAKNYPIYHLPFGENEPKLLEKLD